MIKEGVGTLQAGEQNYCRINTNYKRKTHITSNKVRHVIYSGIDVAKYAFLKSFIISARDGARFFFFEKLFPLF